MEWWKAKRAFLVEVFRKSLFAPRWGGFASDFWVREGSIRTEVVRNSFWMRPVEGEGRVICESGVSTHLLWELSRRVDQHDQQCSNIKLLLAEILARLPDRSQQSSYSSRPAINDDFSCSYDVEVVAWLLWLTSDSRALRLSF